MGDLAELLRIRDSTVSQHLALLRKDGLVTARRDAQTIWYSIASKPARESGPHALSGLLRACAQPRAESGPSGGAAPRCVCARSMTADAALAIRNAAIRTTGTISMRINVMVAALGALLVQQAAAAETVHRDGHAGRRRKGGVRHGRKHQRGAGPRAHRRHRRSAQRTRRAIRSRGGQAIANDRRRKDRAADEVAGCADRRAAGAIEPGADRFYPNRRPGGAAARSRGSGSTRRAPR